MTALAVTASPESVGLCSERLARVDAWREKWVSSGKLPFGITAVLRRGQVVHAGVSGMADVERGVPATLDTIGYEIVTRIGPRVQREYVEGAT